MRVLQLHTRYREPGGEDAVCRREAELLRSGGHEVFVHHAENPRGRVRSALALARSAWNARAARALGAVVEEFRPDVAHVHNTWFAMSPSVVAGLGRLGVPVVMTLHNYRLLCVNGSLYRNGGPCEECVGSHPWHGARHRCYRGSLPASTIAAAAISLNRRWRTWDRDVDLFLASTEFARGRFVAGGFAERDVVVKPHFVEDPGRRADPPSASGTVIYVGRLAPEKGVEAILDAWGRIGADRFRLLIVGDGPLRRRMESRAPAGVRFAGRVSPSRARSLMGESRALLFPSRSYETFGLTAIEAMAAGTPVVATNLGAPAELVGRLGPDWLVDPAAPEGWARAIRSLEDDRRVDDAGARARAVYEAGFTPEIGLRNLISAFELAIRRAR